MYVFHGGCTPEKFCKFTGALLHTRVMGVVLGLAQFNIFFRDLLAPWQQGLFAKCFRLRGITDNRDFSIDNGGINGGWPCFFTVPRQNSNDFIYPRFLLSKTHLCRVVRLLSLAAKLRFNRRNQTSDLEIWGISTDSPVHFML